MPSFTGMDGALAGALERLEKTPIEYFTMLYVDTALFGAPHGVKCVIEFFGPDRVLFETDAPLDTQGGSHFVPTTICDVERSVSQRSARDAIFHDNAERVLGLAAAPS